MRMLSSDSVSRRTSTSIGKSPQNENSCINPKYLCKNNNEYKIGDLTTSIIKRKSRKRLRVLDSNSSNGLICGKTVSRDSIELEADAQLQAFSVKPQMVRKLRPDDKTHSLIYQLKNIKQLVLSPEWTNALKPPINSNDQLSELATMNSTSKLAIKRDSSETPNNLLDNVSSTLVNDFEHSSWQNSASNMNWRGENSSLTFSQMNKCNGAEIPSSGFSTQDSNAHFMISENVLLKSKPNCFWDSFAVQSEFVSQFQPTSMTKPFFNTDYNYSSNFSFELRSVRSYQSYPLEFFK